MQSFRMTLIKFRQRKGEQVMKKLLPTLGLSVFVLVVLGFAAAPSAEARTLRTRLQDDAGSPSDQNVPVQRGPVQKGSPVQKGADCYHQISYHHHCTLRKTSCCSCGTIRQVLMVDDPCCCGKTIAIPVCLPDCCDDQPKSSGHCGPLGRGVTTFHWCCGYKVKVVVDRCGDVTVHSYGR